MNSSFFARGFFLDRSFRFVVYGSPVKRLYEGICSQLPTGRVPIVEVIYCDSSLSGRNIRREGGCVSYQNFRSKRHLGDLEPP